MLKTEKRNKFKRKIFVKRLLKLIIVVFFISISVKIYLVCMKNLESEEELQTVQKKLNNLVSVNENLKNQIDKGLTSEFVEETARNKLKMIMPNERVFFSVAVDE